MEKIQWLDKWTFTETLPDHDRKVYATIHTVYPGYKKLIRLTPVERKRKVAEELLISFKKLINTPGIGRYKVIGTSLKPRGIKATVTLTTLKKIAREPFVEHIFVYKVQGAKKLREPAKRLYFCIKTIFNIQIEGQVRGNQEYEERYMLIRASSIAAAQQKLKKSFREYEEPYLNYAGSLVRWKFEKFEDWFEPDIYAPGDIDRPEGIEIFSLLKTRRLKKENVWAGK